MSCFGSFFARDYDPREDQPAFMSCTIRVDYHRRGWQRSVSRVLRTIQARTCTMNGTDELFEVSGFGVPRALMRAIGRSRNRLKLEWFQYGQCSDYLYDRRQFQVPSVLAAATAVPDMGGIDYPIRGAYYPPTYYYGNLDSCNIM